MRTKTLIAIPAPAPSIPVRWRLYHAGSAYRGRLATHPRDALAYLGDYVYFSTERAYAERYLASARRRGGRSLPKRTTRLYVIDARALPDGARIVARGDGRRVGAFDGYLSALVDLNADLLRLCDASEAGDGVDATDASAPGVPGDERRRCFDAFRRRVLAFDFLGAHALARWFGAGDVPRPEQLELARSEIRERWLATMTRPLRPRAVAATRNAIGLRRAADAQRGHGSMTPLDGTIVLVPGPVRVLRDGWTGIDRSDRRRAPIHVVPEE